MLLLHLLFYTQKDILTILLEDNIKYSLKNSIEPKSVPSDFLSIFFEISKILIRNRKSEEMNSTPKGNISPSKLLIY